MLLTTKFLAPAYNPRSVDRQRLSTLLHYRHGRKLTVVTAPAGYGKTTLVTQWLHTSEAPYCWLALDPSDNEPHRFWEYLVGSIQYRYPEIGKDTNTLLAKTDSIPFEAAVTALINDIAANLPITAQPVSLILDDYHLISAPQIHEQLIYFIDFLPPQLNLVLTTRIEPPIPIAKWQVKNFVDEIYANDLAFSLEESEQFFSDYMSLNLSKEEITQIREKTEGWAAAMQLAGLSSKGGSNNISPNTLSLISGEEKLINDYVLTEILQQQPEHVQSFLLDSSCLFRLNAELCNAIRETEDSQMMLESLEQANLFIIPLDVTHNWFRYHDLFRESLFLRLKQIVPDRVLALQQKAIHWLLSHDHYHEATAQLIQLEDWNWLKQVLEEHGNTLIHQGHHLPVLNWINQLPEQLVETAPRLIMLKIWAFFFSNRINAISPLLQQLESILKLQANKQPEDNADSLDLHSEIALINAYIARTKSDLKSASHLTKQVLDELDNSNMPLKSVTYYGIGMDCYSQGDLQGAVVALESAIRYGKLEKRHATILSSSGLLAWVLYDLGGLDRAKEICSSNQAWIDAHQQESNKPRLISCWQNTALAQLFCEMNEHTAAQTYLNPLLAHLENGTEPGQHIVIQYTQGRLHFSNGEYIKALHCLDDAISVYQHKREAVMFFPPATKSLRIRCFLKLGEDTKAKVWLKESWESITNPLENEQNLLTSARVYLANRQYDESIKLSGSVINSATNNDHKKHLIEAFTLFALAYLGKDDHETCQNAINKALALASQIGYLRVFSEESIDVLDCIKVADQANLSLPFLEALNTTFENIIPLENRPTLIEYSNLSTQNQSKNQSPLLEPLSQRELEVLDLISQGLANKEIANKLCLAPATVKAHIRNLYGKIEAKSRTEALAKARNLGLLS
jgi:LuxR family maltose regulon positive regulatory protein